MGDLNFVAPYPLGDSPRTGTAPTAGTAPRAGIAWTDDHPRGWMMVRRSRLRRRWPPTKSEEPTATAPLSQRLARCRFGAWTGSTNGISGSTKGISVEQVSMIWCGAGVLRSARGGPQLP
ncbi:hypothetical protein LAUMK35_00729 [Mycobacterium pseudokansasii]|nr:hypothetical protein LAUMK35_00729 [Mycobacterium pseudokansasii]VAZ89441.1 hypothetical protein LAUMK21_00727 [Mycobacterium pseudokansasii]